MRLSQGRYEEGLRNYGRYCAKLTGLPPESVRWSAEQRQSAMMVAWNCSFPGLNAHDLYLPATRIAQFVHTHLFKRFGNADVAHPGWPAIAEAYRDLIVTGVCIAFPQVRRMSFVPSIDRSCEEIHTVLTTEHSYQQAFDFARDVKSIDPIQATVFVQAFPKVMSAVGRPELPPDDDHTRLLTTTLYLRLVSHGYLGALMANGKG